MLRSETPSFEKCTRWSAKFGGTNMPLCRNEDLDVWYTTMHKLIMAVILIPVLLPDNILSKTYEGVQDKVAQIIVRSRMVTCYELDLNNQKAKMSMFKNVKGSDIVKVGNFSSKAMRSLTIAANGLPDVQRDMEFTSDALSRRMVCVKMDVDTVEAEFEPDPSDPVHMVDLLCACLCVGVKHSHVPTSSDTLLITFYGLLYFKALLLVGEALTGSVTLLQ